MRTNRRAATLLLCLATALSSCGGSAASRPATTGNVTVALTDAPSHAFDNVWVTVRQVWFHEVVDAPFSDTATGWVRFTLPNGTTVNLAALSGDNTAFTVFDNLAIAAGTYRQMLLFLEPTENALTPSATLKGLAFNNQVDNGALHAALRVPNAAQGIRVEGPFVVAKGAQLRLAIDFNVGRDVLPFNRGLVQEFLLQPRPEVFDLDNAGAIVGFIDNTAAADNTARFEVFAEQVPAGQTAHVVRRAAAVDNATGRFVLYPLVPATTAPLYDIVIRGIGRRTAIITSVPVNGGTTPASNPTLLGTATFPVPMPSAAVTDFQITATSATTGALGTFYQDIGQGPHVIRQANFDPLTGTIAGFPLSGDQVNTAPYDQALFSGGGSITLSTVSPSPGVGSFWLVAEAPLYGPSATPPGTTIVNSTPGSNSPSIPGLVPAAPAVPTTVSVTADVRSGAPPMDNVVFFATFGGTILNVQVIPPVSGTGPVVDTITGLPGGAIGATFSLASYGVSAYGWRTSVDNTLRIGPSNVLAKPQTGPASVSFPILKNIGP